MTRYCKVVLGFDPYTLEDGPIEKAVATQTTPARPGPSPYVQMMEAASGRACQTTSSNSVREVAEPTGTEQRPLEWVRLSSKSLGTDADLQISNTVVFGLIDKQVIAYKADQAGSAIEKLPLPPRLAAKRPDFVPDPRSTTVRDHSQAYQRQRLPLSHNSQQYLRPQPNPARSQLIELRRPIARSFRDLSLL